MNISKIAESNRKHPTEAERALLDALKQHDNTPMFKFQKVLGNMIVDFWFNLKGLVVEIDGESHTDIDKDKRRDLFLSQHDIVVLRFTNEQVISEPISVLNQILGIQDRFELAWQAEVHYRPLTAYNVRKIVGDNVPVKIWPLVVSYRKAKNRKKRKRLLKQIQAAQ